MIKQPEIHEKVWGREIWWVNNADYCSKTLEINKGYYVSLHRHANKREHFITRKGHVVVALENEDGKIKFHDLYEGHVIEIPVGRYHSFYGFDLENEILEASTVHFDSDSYRLCKSGFFHDEQEWENLIIKTWNECEK
jgi:mannose-6-phosphate isomerase-like protein (cupin superfamily)